MARSSKDWPANANFDAQADNATLTSMTVADIHFVPYRPQLNDLGQAHLASIASKLELYGGEVTFDCQQAEPAVRQQRLENVREFLITQRLDPEQLTVVSGLARGRGENVNEASLFYAANLMPDGASSAGESTTAAQP